MKQMFAALLCVLSLGACALSHTERFERDREEEQIYAAVVDSLFSSASSTTLIVRDRTIADRTRDKMVPEYWTGLLSIPGIYRGTVQDFETVNGAPRIILSIPAVRMKIELVQDSMLQNMLIAVTPAPPGAGGEPSNYWRAFHERFPKSAGLASLSRPGISPDGLQALIEVTHGTGSLSGGGFNVLLTKTSSGWKVSRIIPTYRS